LPAAPIPTPEPLADVVATLTPPDTPPVPAPGGADRADEVMAAYFPAGRAVELPGRGVTFIREAQGPPGARTVLLLHGWTVTADLNWFTSYWPLAERYHVVAMDHRGHGRGIRPPDGRVRLSECADDAAALLEVLGVEQAIAVGYSMGGPIAQLLWRRHPERVGGLVLCATAADFQGGPMADLRYRGFGGIGRLAAARPGLSHRALERLVESRVVVGAEGPETEWMRAQLVQADPAGLITALGSLARFRSTGWIGEVDVPAAVVVMRDDRTVPPVRQRALAKFIPEATTHIVDGGHDACGTEPDKFVPALLEACASVSDRITP